MCLFVVNSGISPKYGQMLNMDARRCLGVVYCACMRLWRYQCCKYFASMIDLNFMWTDSSTHIQLPSLWCLDVGRFMLLTIECQTAQRIS